MKTKKIYLMSFYKKIPKNKHSAQKNFSKNPNNWQFNEEVHITRGLKNRDINTATIILNVSDEKIIKRGPNQDVTYAELYQYYAIHYPQYIQVINKALHPELEEQPKLIENKQLESLANVTHSESEKTI